MIRHDLKRVRLHDLDNTLHCTAHGLLNAEETADVLRRAHLSAEQAGRPITQPVLGILARLLDAWAGLTPGRCETIQ